MKKILSVFIFSLCFSFSLFGEEFSLAATSGRHAYSEAVFYVQDPSDGLYWEYEMTKQGGRFVFDFESDFPVSYFFMLDGRVVQDMRTLRDFCRPHDYFVSDSQGGFNALFVPEETAVTNLVDFSYEPWQEDLSIVGVQSFEEMTVDLYIFNEEDNDYVLYPMFFDGEKFSVSVQVFGNVTEFYIAINGYAMTDMEAWAPQISPFIRYFCDDLQGGLNALYISDFSGGTDI